MPITVLGTLQAVSHSFLLGNAVTVNVQVKRQRLELVQVPRAGI